MLVGATPPSSRIVCILCWIVRLVSGLEDSHLILLSYVISSKFRLFAIQAAKDILTARIFFQCIFQEDFILYRAVCSSFVGGPREGLAPGEA